MYNPPVIRALADEFLGLFDPYTGRPLEVFITPTAQGLKYFAPDAYSPGTIVPKEQLCELHKCAYSGEPLTLVQDDEGWYYAGGFDPTEVHDREEFLFYARKCACEQSPKIRVEAVKRTPKLSSRRRRHVDRCQVSIDEYHIHAIEDSLRPFRDLIGGSSTVSMAIGAKQ